MKQRRQKARYTLRSLTLTNEQNEETKQNWDRVQSPQSLILVFHITKTPVTVATIPTSLLVNNYFASARGIVDNHLTSSKRSQNNNPPSPTPPRSPSLSHHAGVAGCHQFRPAWFPKETLLHHSLAPPQFTRLSHHCFGTHLYSQIKKDIVKRTVFSQRMP